jgi:hypothetical protein
LAAASWDAEGPCFRGDAKKLRVMAVSYYRSMSQLSGVMKFVLPERKWPL